LRTSNSAGAGVIGVAIRNANRACRARVEPGKRPAEIEMPDRLMPGTAPAPARADPMATGT
jgi:hypothetical protein